MTYKLFTILSILNNIMTFYKLTNLGNLFFNNYKVF